MTQEMAGGKWLVCGGHGIFRKGLRRLLASMLIRTAQGLVGGVLPPDISCLLGTAYMGDGSCLLLQYKPRAPKGATKHLCDPREGLSLFPQS